MRPKQDSDSVTLVRSWSTQRGQGDEPSASLSIWVLADGMNDHVDDWACGYENDSDVVPSAEVARCFAEKVDSVPVWTKLDRLRKECGHRNMVYTENYLDAKRCAALGGAHLPSQSPW